LRIACAALSRLEEAVILNSQATIDFGDGQRTASLDKLKNARDELEKAVARAKEAEDYLQKAAPKSGPQPLVVLRVGAMSHARRASLLLSQSRALATEDAGRKQGLVTESLNECEAAYGLREAARRNSDTADERGNLAGQAGQCGEMFEQQNNVAKARQYYERQLDLRRGLLAINSDDGVDADQTRRRFESALIDAGYLERTQGDKQTAVAEIDECVKDAEDLVTRAPRPINYHALFYCYAQRGYLARDLDQYGDMRDYFRNAVSSLLEAHRDPALEGVLHEMIASWRRIAEADVKLVDVVDALESDEHAVELARSLYGQRQDDEARDDLIDALGGDSFTLVLNRKFAKAVEAAEEALALNPATKLATKAVKVTDDDWIKVNRAHGLWLQGRKAEAEAIYAELKGSVGRDILNDFGLFLKINVVTADDVKHIQALVGAPGPAK
jgi:tetratricopeptide (TPR) repeat protein